MSGCWAICGDVMTGSMTINIVILERISQLHTCSGSDRLVDIANDVQAGDSNHWWILAPDLGISWNETSTHDGEFELGQGRVANLSDTLLILECT